MEITSNKKNSVFLVIILSPLLILKYALIGLKAITVDRVIKKDYIKEFDESDIAYYRIKGKNKVGEEHPNYSEKILKKLEHDKEYLKKDLQEEGAIRHDKPNIYYFKVKDEKGKIITGTMPGFSKLDVNSFLINEGYAVYTIKTSKWINFVYQESSIFGASKINTKELIFFLTQLSTYLKAGLTLNKSIKILTEQTTKDKNKKRILEKVAYELVLGESFSNALAKQGNIFPQLLINMVKAAEAAGNLTETLDDLVNYYSDIHSVKKQMVSAVAYPITILIFSVVVTTFILIYIVPQFSQIYSDNGSEITGLTLFILNTSEFLKNNIFNIVIIIASIIILIMFGYKHNKSIKVALQISAMKMPVIRHIIIYHEVTIFSKTFASLLKNNVYITDSVDILTKITKNEVYKAILNKTIKNISKGENISVAFEGHWAVPDVAYHMIITGEETGRLAEMMGKVSQYYQEMHKSTINNMKTLLEPFLTAFLAIVVGLIIIAVIVPMYGAMNEIGL